MLFFASNLFLFIFIMSYPSTIQDYFSAEFLNPKFKMWRIRHLEIHPHTAPIPEPSNISHKQQKL